MCLCCWSDTTKPAKLHAVVYFPKPQAVLTNASTSIAAVLLAVVALPESLPAAPVPEGGHKRTRPLDACLSLARSWKLITSRALFMKLALCMAIVGVVSEGIQGGQAKLRVLGYRPQCYNCGH